MTKEELEKVYCADRPTEPYSDDASSNDWAAIAHYAEDYLSKSFERIEGLESTNKRISDECHKLVDTLEKKQKEIAELELKIKHLTEHLEPQKMTALFEQVEEEIRQEQRIAELEQENKALRNDSSDYLQTIKTLSRKLKQNIDITTKAVDIVEEWKKKADMQKGQLTKAKELLRKFLDAKSIEETLIVESETEKFLDSEVSE